MHTAIIAGIPPDSDRRVQAALKQTNPFPAVWEVTWMRSNSRTPGLAPSQIGAARETASKSAAHILIFRGRERDEENQVITNIAPYFRIRWIESTLLKNIPRRMDDFFEAIKKVLSEEHEWMEKVKPNNESSCLLLPECAFSAGAAVRHLWTVASEAGLERIRLAARASERFKDMHWLPNKNGQRAWIDCDDRVFDHRGPRHGKAPFPRNWKFSYQAVPGFHFDVSSRDSRVFHVDASDGKRHGAPALGHINIDPHGYVRI